MSETKQTRCPFCNSVFNITDAQLAARGGHVRCGACLQVFRADQNLVSGGVVTATTESKSAPAPAPTPAAADEKPVAPPIVARTQSAQPLPDPAAQAKKKKKPEDESWAFNLLGEEAEEIAPPEPEPAPPPTPVQAPPPAPAAAPKSKKPLFDDELSDMLHEAWQEKPRDTAQLTGIGEVDKLKASADESWAQALLSEIAEEEKKEQSKNYSMELADSKRKPAPRPEAEPPRSSPRPAPAPAPVESKKPAAAAAVPAPSSSATGDDDLLNFLNSNSAPTLSTSTASLPVEVRDHRTFSINWGYYLTWGFLCLIALSLLIGQYVYFNFARLAVQPDTRPQILALCDTLKCTVPEPPDIRQIAVNKVVVRRHPDIKGALKADAVIYNKADFTQPLPLLKLVLLSRKGEIVAGRVFTPKEYLQGDASKLRRIPPNTLIYISLDIAPPGVESAGYRMEPLFP